MSSIVQTISLSEAANQFLEALPPEDKDANQTEIYKFLRWFGRERPLAALAAAEVANYAERLSLSDTDYMRTLEMTRAFLVYARKQGWSKTNLAIHLKAKKGKSRLPSSSRRSLPEAIPLSREGYDELEAELVSLRSKSAAAIDEIRKAAADKDFRENAPLHAAREQRGHLEGRIMELETTLKLAVVIGEGQESTFKISIGTSVTICDLDSGEEMCYRLVSPREVDPVRGKISHTSPIGRALIGKEQGVVVEVTAPMGKLRYQIKQVER